MRVLLLNYEFPPLGGGAGNATFYLLTEFARNNNIEIDLVTSSADQARREPFADNITIHYLDIGKKGLLHYQSYTDLLTYSAKAYKYCKQLLNKQPYSLVHAFFGIPCGYIAMRLGAPYLVSLRGSDVPFYNHRFYWPDKLLFQYLSRKIWSNARGVIANSQGLKDLALRTAPNQHIEVIYNGVKADQFQPRKNNDNTFTIISTSRLIQRKGIKYLVEAFLDFNRAHPDSRLLLVGEGDLKMELEKQVAGAGLQSSVAFSGSVEHSLLPDYYQQAEVFVLPSLNEGMSNSLLEAMSSGLAVIATDVGGVRELVNDGAAFIVKRKSSSAINQALEQLYSNKDLLKQMQQKCRDNASEYSWELIAQQYLKRYEEMGHTT